jgi:dTDP-4-dehydrorhamnose 3,5-epimerase
MELIDTLFPEVRVVRPRRHVDKRGFFSEVYSRGAFQSAGIDTVFIQDNHTLSVERGVVRGLHFQTPPFAQAKLVRVVRGAVQDVVVDLRHGSPTFGRHATIILSAETWNQVYIPEGFAHGFCTLEPGTEVLYKVNRPYSAAHDRGLLWNDPALGIDWPVDAAQAIVSDKDRQQPVLAELPIFFQYEPATSPPTTGAAAGPGG